MLTIITGKEGSILTSDHSRHDLHCINLLLKKAIEKLRGYVLKFTIFSIIMRGDLIQLILKLILIRLFNFSSIILLYTF